MIIILSSNDKVAIPPHILTQCEEVWLDLGELVEPVKVKNLESDAAISKPEFLYRLRKSLNV